VDPDLSDMDSLKILKVKAGNLLTMLLVIGLELERHVVKTVL
jgi:hypothetical protein